MNCVLKKGGHMLDQFLKSRTKTSILLSCTTYLLINSISMPVFSEDQWSRVTSLVQKEYNRRIDKAADAKCKPISDELENKNVELKQCIAMRDELQSRASSGYETRDRMGRVDESRLRELSRELENLRAKFNILSIDNANLVEQGKNMSIFIESLKVENKRLSNANIDLYQQADFYFNLFKQNFKSSCALITNANEICRNDEWLFARNNDLRAMSQCLNVQSVFVSFESCLNSVVDLGLNEKEIKICLANPYTFNNCIDSMRVMKRYPQEPREGLPREPRERIRR